MADSEGGAPDIHVRPINPDSEVELQLVASRMRETLVEVLGREKAEALHSMEWLMNRLKQHLDPKVYDAVVLLAVKTDGEIIGHTIVRLQPDQDGTMIGYFSTTYVVQPERRHGVAKALVLKGEEFLRGRGMKAFVTHTAVWNPKLQQLFRGFGYEMKQVNEEFVELRKRIAS